MADPQPNQAAPIDLSGGFQPKGIDLSGGFQPVNTDATGVNAQSQPGFVSRAWDWANRGLVSGKTLVNAAGAMIPKPADMKQGESTYDYLTRMQGKIEPDHPYMSALRTGIAGVTKDVFDTASSMGTSPLAIATFGAGPLIESLFKGAQATRAAVNAAKALRTAQTAAGVGFAGQGLYNAGEAAFDPTKSGWEKAAGISGGLGQAILGGTGAVEGYRGSFVPTGVAAINRAIDPLSTMTPSEIMSRGTKPRNTLRDIIPKIDTALPHAAAAADQLGLSVDPAKAHEEALISTRQAKQNVWDTLEQNHLAPAATFTRNTDSVANGIDAIATRMSPIEQRRSANLVDKIHAAADDYRGQSMSVQDMEQRIQEVNNDLYTEQGIRKVDLDTLKRDPQYGYKFAELEGLRSTLNNALDQITGPGAAQLKKTYGSLKALEDILERSINIANRPSPVGLYTAAGRGAGMGNIAGGAYDILTSPFGGGSENLLRGGGKIGKGVVQTWYGKKLQQLNDRNFLVSEAFRRSPRAGTPPGPSVAAQAAAGFANVPPAGPPTPPPAALPPGQYNAPGSSVPIPPTPQLTGQVINPQYLAGPQNQLPPKPPIRGPAVQLPERGSTPSQQRILPPIGLFSPGARATPSLTREAVGMPETAEAAALQRAQERRGPAAALQPPPPSTTPPVQWTPPWEVAQAAKRPPAPQTAQATAAAPKEVPPPAPPPTERRVNVAERKRVAEMSPEEMRSALLTSHQTGIPNERAFHEAQSHAPAPVVAVSDVDGLSAFNDKFGHDAGDAVIKAKAEALQRAGVESYHLHGDEYAHRGEDEATLRQKLDAAREDLKKQEFDFEDKNGNKYTVSGVDFSHGTGTDQASADRALYEQKTARTAAGERAPKGQLARTINVAQRGNQELPQGPQEVAPPPTPAEAPVSTAKQNVQVAQGERIAGHDGAPTNLLTSNGNKYPGRYRIVEAADLKPSHDPETFAKKPDYPEGIQERSYHSSKDAQMRVIEQEQKFDPSFILNTTPTATDGPPVIKPDGTVLGGNSRVLTLARVANRGRYQSFQEPLAQQAQQFGLDPEQVRGMKQPVLVREVEAPSNADELRRMASDLNKPFTGELSKSERAVSAGRSLKQESLEHIGTLSDELGEDTTMRELLEKRGKQLLDVLQRDGIITDRERPRYTDTNTGGLNEDGKNFVEKALLGSVVDDPDLMDRTPKNILNKLGGSLGDIASLSGRSDGYNITALLRSALREHASAAQAGGPLEDYLSQQGMFGPKRTEAVESITRKLGEKPKAFRAAIKSFAQDARMDVEGQSTMLLAGELSPVNAFNHAFGTKLTESEFTDALRQALESERPTGTAQARALGPAGIPRSIMNK